MESIDLGDLVQILLTGVVGVIGWFLRELYTDIKALKMEIGEQKTKTSLIEQKSDARIDKLTEVTDLHIKQLNKSIEELNSTLMTFSHDVKNLLKK